jgi:hypothetical protein
MQGRNVTAVEYCRAESSPYISVEVLMEMKKFCIWSYSFTTLQSSRWLEMFQMDQQALRSSKTPSITHKNTWRHNLEHQNLTVLIYLLHSLKDSTTLSPQKFQCVACITEHNIDFMPKKHIQYISIYILIFT